MLPRITEWQGALDGGAEALADSHNAEFHPDGMPAACPWPRCPLHDDSHPGSGLPAPFMDDGTPRLFVAGADEDTACYPCALAMVADGGWAESDGPLVDDPADPVRCRFCEMPVAVIAELSR